MELGQAHFLSQREVLQSISLETKHQGLFLQTSVESFLDNTLEQETTVSPKFVQDGNR